MDSQRKVFIEALEQYDTIIVTGPTGCGKSTNVPKWIVEQYPERKTILLQPRRLPTQRIAERICQLCNFQMTNQVGFIMGRRFFESPTNRIVVATTGSALNTLISHPDRYDYIIIDEIHEQNCFQQQAIALAAEYQKKYHFKVILMSATIDVANYSQTFPGMFHFELAPQVDADRKQIFDQEMQNLILPDGAGSLGKITSLNEEQFKAFVQDPENSQSKKLRTLIIDNMAIQVARIVAGQVEPQLDGDILAFVPGIRDFDALSQGVTMLLRKLKLTDSLKIKYLHSRFSEELKQELMVSQEEHPQRQLIISTTIAETSLTIPTLSYVVDSCLNNNKSATNMMYIGPCSYDAVMQRMGRVGRVAPGVYIPCIDVPLLDLLPQSYKPEDVTSNMDSFILKYYLSKKQSEQIDMVHLLTQASDKITEAAVLKLYRDMERRGLLLKVSDDAKDLKNNYLVTTHGYMMAQAQKDLSESSFFSLASLIGPPQAMSLLIGVEGEQSLEIFVHEMELTMRASDYCSARAIPYHSFVEWCGFMHGVRGLNFQTLSPQIIQATEAKNNFASFFEMVRTDPNTTTAKSYSHRYAKARIVALWRHYFPVPTQYPTLEEQMWCDQRLLSPSGLREVELEMISQYQRLKLFQPSIPAPQFIEQGLIAQRWPTTVAQLNDFFKEMKYDFQKAPERHVVIWQKASIRFCGPTYVPMAAGFLQAEKLCSKDSLVQLTVLLEACQQKFGTFIHSKANLQSPVINTNVFNDAGNQKTYKNIRMPQLKPKIKAKGQVTEGGPINKALAKYTQEIGLRGFKLSARLKFSVLQSINVAGPCTVDGILQLTARVFTGPKSIVIQSVTISDIPDSLNMHAFKQQLLGMHKSIPTALSLITEVKDFEPEEITESGPNEDSSPESEETQQAIPKVTIDKEYIDQELLQKLTQIKPTALGQVATNRDIDSQSQSLNYYSPDDFSFYTCGFFSSFPKLQAFATSGLAIYLLASLLIEQNVQVFYKFAQNLQLTDVAIVLKPSGVTAFGYSFGKQPNKSDKIVMEFFCALPQLHELFKRQLLKLSPQARSIPTQAWQEVADKLKPQIQPGLCQKFEELELGENFTATSAIFAIIEHLEQEVIWTDKLALACVGAFQFDSSSIGLNNGWIGGDFMPLVVLDQKE